MIKILFVTSGLGLGGAERQLVQLATALDPNEFHVAVLCLSRNEKKAYCSQLHKLEILEMDLKSLLRGPLNLFLLTCFLYKFKADIFHGWMYGGNIVASLLGIILRKPIIMGIRSSNMDDVRYRTQILLNSLLSRYATWIVSNSFVGKEFHLSKGYPDYNHSVISNGIDVSKFFHSATAGQNFRKMIGVKPDEWLFLYAARVDPMKGHDKILELAERYHNAKFLLVGSGTERLEASANVICLGALDEMHNVYNAADFLISVSKYGEGFPNVIGEAMACGLNVITNQVGDSAAIVGDFGIVFGDGQKVNLEAHLQSIISLPREEKRNMKARGHIIQNYSTHKMVKQYQALFQSVIMKNRK